METITGDRGIPADFDPADLRPPARWELLREGRVVFECLNLAAAGSTITRGAPRGAGQRVLIVPGFATDDSWTARLRKFLVAIGYDASGWGLGRNNGRVPSLIPKVVERCEQLASGGGQPVRLIGWSLGGYLVRWKSLSRSRFIR